MAEITITNSQGAMMRSNPSTPGAWDSSHDATSAGFIDTTNNSGTAFTLGCYYSGYGGGTYSIHRCFLDFDLSGIPSGATINSAKLKIYGASSTSPHASVSVYESDFIILKGTFTDGTTLATTMFDEFEGFQAGWDGTDAGIIEYSGEEASSWSTSAYNEITLNSSAISDITSRAGGSTRLAMVLMNHDHDYHDDPNGHDGNPLSPTYDYFKINFNMDPSESNPPQLVVDYTEGPPYSFAGGGGNFPAIYAKINGLSKVTNDFKVNGFKDVHVNGIAEPNEIVVSAAGTPTTYLDENFDDLVDGTNYPTNWNGSTGLTVYGSTTSTHQWRANDRYTGSGTTGPYSHHGGSPTSGVWGDAADAYMYTEASGIYNKDHLLRTPVLDFSNSLANNTLKLTFWFHMGNALLSGTDYMGELMVGVSDSATSAADGSVGTGFSGAADDASSRTGMTIEYWDTNDNDGSSTASGIVIAGRQQTSYHSSNTPDNYWRKATVDLNAVAGESTVYIWFYGRTGSLYQSDICIDTVLVTGEE